MRVNSVAYMKINEAVHLRSMLYLQTLEYRADLGFKQFPTEVYTAIHYCKH